MKTHADGFTLIETMVAVIIIGILIAIAIPTFLGAKDRSADRRTQSNLQLTRTEARSLFSPEEPYDGSTVTALTNSEPSLVFQDSAVPSTDAAEVSLATPSPAQLLVASYSASGTCFWLRDVLSTGSTLTTYAKADVPPSECVAADPPAAFDSSW